MSRPKWDALAASTSIALFFVILFVFAVFETYVYIVHIGPTCYSSSLVSLAQYRHTTDHG